MARQKAKMSSSNKIRIYSLIFLIIPVFLGILLYNLTQESLKTTPVVVTVNDIKAGSMIGEGDIATISVGKNGIQSNIAITKASVVGKYALRDLKANEYVFSTSITDDYMKRLSEKAKYGAIAIPIDNLQAVTGDIKENDFVGAYISVQIDKSGENMQGTTGTDVLPNANTALIYSSELTAVRVLGMYDGAGRLAGKAAITTDSSGKTNYVSPSMIVFDAMPAQRTLLIQAIDNGRVRLIIHPEYIQREYRKAWGLEGAGSIDSPEEQLQEDEARRKLEEKEEIKARHEALSNDKTVNTYMDDVKEQNRVTEDQIQNQDRLNPEENRSNLSVPDNNE